MPIPDDDEIRRRMTGGGGRFVRVAPDAPLLAGATVQDADSDLPERVLQAIRQLQIAFEKWDATIVAGSTTEDLASAIEDLLDITFGDEEAPAVDAAADILAVLLDLLADEHTVVSFQHTGEELRAAASGELLDYEPVQKVATRYAEAWDRAMAWKDARG